MSVNQGRFRRWDLFIKIKKLIGNTKKAPPARVSSRVLIIGADLVRDGVCNNGKGDVEDTNCCSEAVGELNGVIAKVREVEQSGMTRLPLLKAYYSTPIRRLPSPDIRHHSSSRVLRLVDLV
jgi:hypothetical protein